MIVSAPSPITAASREEWLAIRQTGISASDVAAALGISPWKSRFELWAEKTGLVESADLSKVERVRWGNRLERAIIDGFGEETGRLVKPAEPFTIARHPEHSFLLATPDAEQFADQFDGPGDLQIKTTDSRFAADWSDEPPLYYQVQMQAELAVTGLAWGSLAVLIGGNELRYFDQPRNDAFIAAMIDRVREFWEMVESKTTPEVDGTAATARALAKLHPHDNGTTAALPQEAIEWDKLLTDAKEAIKAAEEIKLACENRIKGAIGESTFGVLPDGTLYTFKTQERKAHHVAASSFRVLRRAK